MEFTSCPRMLHSQPAGSTEIRACDLYIQSPMHYPFSHHVTHIKPPDLIKQQDNIVTTALHNTFAILNMYSDILYGYFLYSMYLISKVALFIHINYNSLKGFLNNFSYFQHTSLQIYNFEKEFKQNYFYDFQSIL